MVETQRDQAERTEHARESAPRSKGSRKQESQDAFGTHHAASRGRVPLVEENGAQRDQRHAEQTTQTRHTSSDGQPNQNPADAAEVGSGLASAPAKGDADGHADRLERIVAAVAANG